jgi:threonine/homoserine/homoserine lactone efflux protein
MERLLAFCGLALVLILIPGPSVIFIVGRAVLFGRAGALLTVASNAAGQYLQVIAVAIGIGQLVESSAVAFTFLKLAGAAYLLLLGLSTWLSRGRASLPNVSGRPTPRAAWPVARAGLVVGVTNPKTALFFVVVLPEFVDRASGGVPLQILELGLVWVVLVLIGDSAWALLGARAHSWLARSPRRASAATGASGAVTACLGLWLAFTGNHA